jgi:ornithine cyclodeaminase/alanine dehydrogenase-like protein (mu-crystallin family)
MALLLTDADLSKCLSTSEAIAAVRDALEERRRGTAVSHPRTFWPVGSSGFTITPGGFNGRGLLGMRVYLRGGSADDQLTAVWESTHGRLEGLIVGSELGAIRTGAIGGVAYDRLAPVDTSSAAVVGGGPQSWSQLCALRVVRPGLSSVTLYRRDPHRCQETARRWSKELRMPVTPIGRAEGAVGAAQVVILATDSATPVVRADWLQAGAHVSSLGPKYAGRSEIGLDLIEWADEIVCDFPEEYRRDEEFLLHGSPKEQEIEDLAGLARPARDRPPDRKTLFLSHGLAGTEVAVAHVALVNARARGVGLEIPDRA